MTMENNTFQLKETFENTDWVFDILEKNINGVVTYEVKISEPQEFASMNEIEMPVSMKYDPTTGELVFDSIQDLSDFKYLESRLSQLINHRNA
jgi:hypothetical protein